ncbi:hypothetical protein FDP41_005809 [Naegleria fowleri]|uniref:Uncharacterized protein n=1 Tax=Naegleria fowleri TaxID=5763 RepID=A0A6A5BJN3_NAEFO|nr:uncharacterized protein FDP41_005809 [Naegleria fowleri]KAF0975056.1 hypothetical protein FDP41_005809 [Naegleria fowleri]CAG4711844.1 unnamed protein product [Naegleria fowleri]
MGNCLGGNKQNHNVRPVAKNKDVKLLLLGAGESGKSTLFKQFKILKEGTYTPDERAIFASTIKGNIIRAMISMVEACDELGEEIEKEENKQFAQELIQLDDENALLNVDAFYNAELVQKLKQLWADTGIQNVLQRRDEYQLLDSTEYFYQRIDAISEKNYVPTDKDILMCRTKTTGVVELKFEQDDTKVSLIDVGGQRNERKKWIHCFENVTAILFVASMSEFDQKCYEDDSTNRIQESLLLFDEIVNSRYFIDTPVIFFLNKKDIFQKKIETKKLSDFFPDYQGPPHDFDATSKYMLQKFTSRINDQNREFYPFITCATDTDNVKNIFDSVKKIVIKK